MNHIYNKMPKKPELLKAIRRAITKDIRENGLSFDDFANEIGLSAGTLENKLKPACHTSDITIHELIHIMDITADYGVLELIAKRYGFMLCKPEGERARVENVISYLTIGTLDLGSVFGELEKVVKEAIEDGVIDEDEGKTIGDIAYQIRKLAKRLEDIAKEAEDEN